MYSHWSGKLKPKQILQRQLHTKNMLLLQLFSTTQILKENELSAQGKYHLCEVFTHEQRRHKCEHSEGSLLVQDCGSLPSASKAEAC